MRVSMTADSGSDLIEDPNAAFSDSVTSTKGFALREAPTHAFELLDVAVEVFERGGAYAIRDAEGEIGYMGYSKNIAAKLAFHARLVPEKCVSFQVYVPPMAPELISPEMLENVLEFWVRENGAIPPGNTVDRALWEQDGSVDRKRTNTTESGNATTSVDSDIPIRERTTPRRVATRTGSASYETVDPFVDSFEDSTGSASRRRRREGSDAWRASDDDYVEVDVDPLDPFSVSKKRRSTSGTWDSTDVDDDEVEEDWIPIVALMGCAGLIWLFGVLTNALPAATPSLGM